MSTVDVSWGTSENALSPSEPRTTGHRQLVVEDRYEQRRFGRSVSTAERRVGTTARPAPPTAAIAGIIVALIGGACSRTSSASSGDGTVAIEGASWDLSRVRLRAGVYWPRDVPAARIGSDGSFRVPADSRIVTAYFDTNGNGRLDLLQEPSTACTRRAHRWACTLEPASIFVHRVRHKRGGQVEDDQYVVGEAYDPTTAEPVPSATLCSDEGACGTRSSGPFYGAAGQAMIVRNCGIGDAQGGDFTLAVGEAEARARVEWLEPLDARVRLDSGFLSVEVDRPVARFAVSVVSTSDREIQHVFWSSIHGTELARPEPGMLRLPAPTDHGCNGTNCQLLVQLVAEELNRDVATFVEHRELIDYGELDAISRREANTNEPEGGMQ